MRETSVEPTVDRFYLLAPALLILATFAIGAVVYWVLCRTDRAPKLGEVKHNQLFGPFSARLLAWLLSPIERALAGRVSPNFVTALSLLFCALTGIAVAIGDLPRAVWLVAVAGFLDVLDGRIARGANRQTAAGALFDSVSDRWGELFVFAGFAWLLHDSPWLLAVIAAYGGSMMVSYTRARAEALGIELAIGVMQRAERIVMLSVGTLIAAWFGSSAGALDLEVVTPILGCTMIALALSSTTTAVNRWIQAYRALAAREAVAPAVVVPLAPRARAPIPEGRSRAPTPEVHPHKSAKVATTGA
jgi:CDP-diacylglycerol--glycerol-3-phosphate 3-phosphatidyltransferase